MSLLSVSKERAWRDRNKCEPFFGKAQLLERIWHLEVYIYVSKNSNKMAGNLKIKA